MKGCQHEPKTKTARFLKKICPKVNINSLKANKVLKELILRLNNSDIETHVKAQFIDLLRLDFDRNNIEINHKLKTYKFEIKDFEQYFNSNLIGDIGLEFLNMNLEEKLE